jgi:hypothetical protein
MLGAVASGERPLKAKAILARLAPSISIATAATSQMVARKARVASGASIGCSFYVSAQTVRESFRSEEGGAND